MNNLITIMIWKLSWIIIIKELSIICDNKIPSKTIEELFYDYEDDKNSMIAISENENALAYDDFYDELDNWMAVENSMNIIFFGPSISFMRLDAETILHLLMHTKKPFIPISKTLLAWDLITDGNTAAYLQGREYLAFGSLLNLIPEEDLYYVNFGDPSVLKFFSNYMLPLHRRKYGILVTSYKRYYGTEWYTNGSYINDLGYMLCGFSAGDLVKISPEAFKEISVETLNKQGSCTVKQTQHTILRKPVLIFSQTLYNIATHREAYGKPYQWSSHEISKFGMLFTFIPEDEICSIQLEAITAITPEVMKALNQEKLEFFTKQQIFMMNPKTRNIFILRMQLKNSLDMNQIVKKGIDVFGSSTFAFYINLVVAVWSPLLL